MNETTTPVAAPITAPTVCYHADASYVAETGEFEVIAIQRDEPGYWVLDTHAGLEQATGHAATLNQQRGVDQQLKHEIMASSLAVSRPIGSHA